MNAPSLASLLFLALPLSQALAQSGALRSPAPGQAGLRSAAPPLETSLTSYEGFVEVQRSGEQTRRQVTFAPFPLSDGDRIHTFRRGQAVIRFKDGSQVTLGPYTVFTIELQTVGGITLSLGLGRLRALVAKLKGREFKIRTAVAVASVRGTEFEVGVTSEGLGDVAVHEGLVAVANLRGDEILLAANQRLEVFADRMGRVEHFEGRPERGRKDDAKKPEKGDKRPERREPGDDRRGDRGRLREALEREIDHHLQREAIESSAAFEHKAALYQEGKTLIDAFGQRVRLEQFITRPDPKSFKQVTLNFREQRLDFSSFEVTANAPLPPDLKLAGNLWFSPTGSKPPFYAVKQRWLVSNGIDSVTRMSLDGDSLRIEVPGQPVFNPDLNQFVFTPGAFHQTIFGHIYEFINGDPVALNGIYQAPLGSARPLDLPSMMWHMVPVRLEVRDSLSNLPILNAAAIPFHYFDYAFRTVNGAPGTTGKIYVDLNAVPDPTLAHFIEFRSYLNFQDAGGTGGNGILDFGEKNHPGAVYGLPAACNPGTGVGCVYDDMTAIGLWNPAFNGGKGGLDFTISGGLPLLGAGLRQATGDAAIFVDANNNGFKDTGEPVVGVTQGAKDPNLLAFAKNNFRDFQETETFLIDDFGFIQPNPAISSQQGVQQNQAGALFQTFNLERVIRSSRFLGRKIDLVMVPHLFLQSGQLSASPNNQGAPAPNAEPPGN